MTLYEYYNTGDDDNENVSGNSWVAQTFTTVGLNENHNITSVKLKLYRVGSPGTVTVSIRATDANGHPTGSDLTSGTIDGDSLTTNSAGEWYEITLTSYQLSVSTKYAIVVRATAGDFFNYVGWRADSTTPTYSGGNHEDSSDSGSTWTAHTDCDLMFEVYGTSAGGSGWQYYKQIDITDTGNVSADYQMKLTVYSGSGSDSTADGIIYCNNYCESFPDDIRFGTTNDPSTAEQLAQWIEESDATSATIWVKLPSNGSNTFYMFVGNSGASQYSSGDDTFLFFSDSSDAGNWTTTGLVSVSAVSGELKISQSATTTAGEAKRTVSISETKYYYEYKIRILNPGDGSYRQCLVSLADSSGNWGTTAWEGRNDNRDAFWAWDGGTAYILYDPSSFDYQVIQRAIVDEDSQETDFYVISTDYSSTLGSGTNYGFRHTAYTSLDHIYIYDGTGGNAAFDIRVAWFRFRKYASTEPSWDTFGSWTAIGGGEEETIERALDSDQSYGNEIYLISSNFNSELYIPTINV